MTKRLVSNYMVMTVTFLSNYFDIINYLVHGHTLSV